MKRSLFMQLIGIFILTQLIGVAVGANLISAIEVGEIEQPTIVTENPDDPINSIALIVYILAFTAFLLLFMRYFKGAFLFKALEILVAFSASLIVFAVFFESVAFALAVLLVALRLLLPGEILIRNTVAIISIAGVGALIGVTLGVIPVLLFLILLSVYDFIAVFKTRHMVLLAKRITSHNLAFTVAMPTKEHRFELGTGDLVMPLLFAVSVMKAEHALGFPLFLVPAAMVLAASLAGLLLTLYYVSGHVGKALPALPLQALLMIAAWGIANAIGF